MPCSSGCPHQRPRSAPSSANPLNPFLFPPSHFLFAGARLAAAASSFIIRQSPAKTRETRASLLIPQNQCRLKLLCRLPHRYISLPSTYTSPYLAYCLTKDSALRNARHCPTLPSVQQSRSQSSTYNALPHILPLQEFRTSKCIPAFRAKIALPARHLYCPPSHNALTAAAARQESRAKSKS